MIFITLTLNTNLNDYPKKVINYEYILTPIHNQIVPKLRIMPKTENEIHSFRST
jgi:hypothetical protein